MPCLGGLAVVVAAVTVGAVAFFDAAPSAPRITTPPAPETLVGAGWTTYWDDSHGISISVPPSWQAAASTLTPALGDPTVRLAVGTYALEPQRQGDCDIVPDARVNALGPTDAFIAVYLTRGFASFGSTTPRPQHFAPDMFRAGFQCSQSMVNGAAGSFHFLDHDRKISVIVAVGHDASPERNAAVYEILDTLFVGPNG